jgi:hypothetical protein
MHNKTMLANRRLYVKISQLSLKHLGRTSWETGGPGEHFTRIDIGGAQETILKRHCDVSIQFLDLIQHKKSHWAHFRHPEHAILTLDTDTRNFLLQTDLGSQRSRLLGSR